MIMAIGIITLGTGGVLSRTSNIIMVLVDTTLKDTINIMDIMDIGTGSAKALLFWTDLGMEAVTKKLSLTMLIIGDGEIGLGTNTLKVVNKEEVVVILVQILAISLVVRIVGDSNTDFK